MDSGAYSFKFYMTVRDQKQENIIFAVAVTIYEFLQHMLLLSNYWYSVSRRYFLGVGTDHLLPHIVSYIFKSLYVTSSKIFLGF